MTLCLTMIVRDEEAIIERCLQAVRPLIDSWLVVDTGSEDQTRKAAARVLADLPGEIVERPWRNCGENMSELLALARGRADWLLWLHADMTIEAHPALREWLDADEDPETAAWNVAIVGQGTMYRLPLLVRGDLDWRYEGVTHEYLAPYRKRRSLLGLTVHHHEDGSNRASKLERDRALLEAELKRDPTNARTVFYLAQTYRFLGENEKAIVLYRQRAAMDGWEEEAWYAGYQAAALARDPEELLAVWRQRPWRPEPLRAAAALVSQQPHDDVLFVENPAVPTETMSA